MIINFGFGVKMELSVNENFVLDLLRYWEIYLIILNFRFFLKKMKKMLEIIFGLDDKY